MTAAKRKEKENRKGEKKLEKPKDRSQKFDFCACLSQNVAKRDASGRKAKLS